MIALLIFLITAPGTEAGCVHDGPGTDGSTAVCMTQSPSPLYCSNDIIDIDVWTSPLDGVTFHMVADDLNLSSVYPVSSACLSSVPFVAFSTNAWNLSVSGSSGFSVHALGGDVCNCSQLHYQSVPGIFFERHFSATVLSLDCSFVLDQGLELNAHDYIEELQLEIERKYSIFQW